MHPPKISIVVVNKDLGNFLGPCLDSILNQHYPNLELIVVDGGSTDQSLESIRQREPGIAWWVSEPDAGPYFALMKGFQHASGDIMAWLNSDDLLMPGALQAVSEVFTSFPEVSWIMGTPTEISQEGVVLNRITLPWARWSKRRFLTRDFQFIQQESVFWRRSLWNQAGAKLDTSLKLAADMELWTRFFRFAELHTISVLTGGFRYRKNGQRSREMKLEYLAECREVLRRWLREYSLPARAGFHMLRMLMFIPGLFWFLDLPVLRGLYKSAMGIPDLISFDPEGQRFFRGRNIVKHPPLFLFGRQLRNIFRNR